MTLDQWIIFATLALTLVLFIWGRWRYDLLALLVGDYWRMGLLLEVIVVVVAIPLLLIFWTL